MFRYRFTDTDDYRARRQAEEQAKLRHSDPKERDEYEQNRFIGNLGELAFANFCHQALPSDAWSWIHGECFHSYPATEYDEYDFDVHDRRVEVKTSCRSSTWIRSEAIDSVSGSPSADIYVWVRLIGEQDTAMVLGWTWRSEVDRARGTAREGTSELGPPGEFEHFRLRSLAEFKGCRRIVHRSLD